MATVKELIGSHPRRDDYSIKRHSILNELRDLVLNDKNALETILTGKKPIYNKKPSSRENRKWELFLKYSNNENAYTDFEFQRLSYLEFKKIYLANADEKAAIQMRHNVSNIIKKKSRLGGYVAKTKYKAGTPSVVLKKRRFN